MCGGGDSPRIKFLECFIDGRILLIEVLEVFFVRLVGNRGGPEGPVTDVSTGKGVKKKPCQFRAVLVSGTSCYLLSCAALFTHRI